MLFQYSSIWSTAMQRSIYYYTRITSALLRVKSLPPETHGEARASGLHVVPPTRGNIQHRAGLQQAVEEGHVRVSRELFKVRGQRVHATGIRRQAAGEGVQAGRGFWRRQPDIFLPDDLREQVLVRVGVPRRDGPSGPEPGVCCQEFAVAKATVVGEAEVPPQSRRVVEERELPQANDLLRPRRACVVPSDLHRHMAGPEGLLEVLHVAPPLQRGPVVDGSRNFSRLPPLLDPRKGIETRTLQALDRCAPPGPRLQGSLRQARKARVLPEHALLSLPLPFPCPAQALLHTLRGRLHGGPKSGGAEQERRVEVLQRPHG